MKNCFKIMAMLGLLAGGILLVDYKTNILMSGKQMTIVDKVTSQVQSFFRK